MKTSLASRKSRSRKARLPSQPRYGEGLRYDTPGLRYAITDPVPVPVNEGAKVKLELARRNDDNLDTFAAAHADAIAGKPLYATPVPSAVDFQAGLDEFHMALLAADNAKLALKDATSRKDAARAVLELLFDQRGLYVQQASNGNESAILSAGLPVRSAPAPTGQLPPPSNLQVHLNGVTALMLLGWNPVAKSEGYGVQWSEVVIPRVWKQFPRVSKPKMELAGMDVGKTYAFQVAAFGGSTGQSYWSPEVIRAAA